MKNNIVVKIIFVLFLIFLALYFSSNAGIIDYQSKNQAILTEKQIKEFEQDVKNNVNIDVKKYLKNTKEEYNNSLSKITLKISNDIGNTINDILNMFFNSLEHAMKK